MRISDWSSDVCSSDLGPQAGQTLVASAAIEDSVPDVAAANALSLPRMTRADLNAALFNAADKAIGVGGTSGKSTETGMIGWILESTGAKPTVMTGAGVRNFAGAEMTFASALVGEDRKSTRLNSRLKCATRMP